MLLYCNDYSAVWFQDAWLIDCLLEKKSFLNISSDFWLEEWFCLVSDFEINRRFALKDSPSKRLSRIAF